MVATKLIGLTLLVTTVSLAMCDVSADETIIGDESEIVLQDNRAEYLLDRHLYYLQGTGQLSLDQVRLLPASAWQSSSKVLPRFDRNKTYWFTFRLRNHSEQHKEWILETSELWVTLINVYYLKQGKPVQTLQSGYKRPFTQRPIQHRDILFPLNVEARESVQVYFSAYRKQQRLRILPLRLWERSAYFKQSRLTLLFWSLCWGMMLVMILYNAMVYLLLKDKAYLLYVGYSATVLLLLLGKNGIAFQYFWLEESTFWRSSGPINASASSALLCLFVSELLGLNE